MSYLKRHVVVTKIERDPSEALLKQLESESPYTIPEFRDTSIKQVLAYRVTALEKSIQELKERWESPERLILKLYQIKSSIHWKNVGETYWNDLLSVMEDVFNRVHIDYQLSDDAVGETFESVRKNITELSDSIAQLYIDVEKYDEERQKEEMQLEYKAFQQR